MVGQVGSPERLDVEKPQSRSTSLDGALVKLPVPKQMDLILTNVVRT